MGASVDSLVDVRGQDRVHINGRAVVVIGDKGCRGRECTLLLDETGNLNEPR